ncbi:MAG TPA: CopG family transcriptional regulator [Kamptonema sp.]|nr:CopG family transcriptional regulator [Kamptonema sp.]
MTKDKKLVLRLTQYELEKLKAFAHHKDVTMSHVLREYIRRLPMRPEPETPIT